MDSLTEFHCIAVADDVKYLGVTFDKKLDFDCHFHNLKKKLSRSVGISAKVKPFLNSKTLLQLYCATFHSHLKYGILAWSPTYYYENLIKENLKPSISCDFSQKCQSESRPITLNTFTMARMGHDKHQNQLTTG